MEEVLIVTTTAAAKDVLVPMGRELLERRLVACVQIVGPVRSLYWWKEAIEDTEEWLAVLKTRASLYGELEEAIRSLHPYEVPEIVAVPAARLSPAYQAWLLRETGFPGPV